MATAMLGYAALRWLAVPMRLVLVVQLVGTLGLAAWRWRVQRTVPQALPVGRMA